MNHHQVKMIISRVTEVQGSNLLVTARKSTSYNNETILGDHHRLPPPTHFGVRHPGMGWSLLLFISYKSQEVGPNVPTLILQVYSFTTGFRPHPLTAGYTNQRELSCDLLLQLTSWDNHHFIIQGRWIF